MKKGIVGAKKYSAAVLLKLLRLRRKSYFPCSILFRQKLLPASCCWKAETSPFSTGSSRINRSWTNFSMSIITTELQVFPFSLFLIYFKKTQ